MSARLSTQDLHFELYCKALTFSSTIITSSLALRLLHKALQSVFKIILLVAKCLSVRQIIPRCISQIVCMYVCMYDKYVCVTLENATISCAHTRAQMYAHVTLRNVTARAHQESLLLQPAYEQPSTECY